MSSPPRPVRALRRWVAAVVLLAALLAACGGDTGGREPTVTGTPASPTATTAPTPTTDATTTSDTAPTPFPADTEPDTGEASAGPIAVTEVRVGAHESFDRVVFTIEGDGEAGWQVRYVDQARSQGSGSEVALEGGAVLEVVITNTAYPMDAPATPFTGERVDTGALTTIRDLVNDNIFEGRHVFFVGTEQRTPFRVFRLEDPQRVVLDVRHP